MSTHRQRVRCGGRCCCTSRGVVLLIVGAATRSGVTALGALLLAVSWSVVGVAFAAMLKRSRVRDQLHARCVLGFWIFGIASALLVAGALAMQEVGIAAVAVSLMVFAFVVPITVTVAHRVLPFFTSSAVSGFVPWRPNWVLGLLLVGVLVFGVVQVLARVGPAADRSLAWLTLATMAPAAAALTALSIQWGLTQSLRGVSLRLLAMLHLAFFWIPIALLLAAIDAALLLAWGDAAPRLGLMPLHALTVGFLGSMLFAMATRVIRGHGRVPGDCRSVHLGAVLGAAGDRTASPRGADLSGVFRAAGFGSGRLVCGVGRVGGAHVARALAAAS